MINNYTLRIQKIAEFVSHRTVAEIGADHGYITKYLFNTNKINFAYLTDISSNSLQKAVKNFAKTPKNKVSFLVGDGLEVFKTISTKIPKEIIIAGMGGKEIIKILTKNIHYNNFVLQPQKNVLEVRKFLNKNNYKILKDEVVKSGKIYYFVLKVKKIKTKQKLTKQQLMFGLTNIKNFSPSFLSYLKYEQQKNEQILKTKYVEEVFIRQKEIEKILTKKGELLNVWKNTRISKTRRENFIP